MELLPDCPRRALLARGPASPPWGHQALPQQVWAPVHHSPAQPRHGVGHRVSHGVSHARPTCRPTSWPSLSLSSASCPTPGTDSAPSAATVLAGAAGQALAAKLCFDRPPQGAVRPQGHNDRGLLWGSTSCFRPCLMSSFSVSHYPVAQKQMKKGLFREGHSLFIKYNLIKCKEQDVVYSKTQSFPSGGHLWYT